MKLKGNIMQETRRQKGKKLERWIAENFKEIGDKYARPTRMSGGGTEIGDVFSNYFFVESKSWNKKNINIPIRIIDHLKERIPINSDRIPIWAFKNNEGKIFVTMEARDFFYVIKDYIRRKNEEE